MTDGFYWACAVYPGKGKSFLRFDDLDEAELQVQDDLADGASEVHIVHCDDDRERLDGSELVVMSYTHDKEGRLIIKFGLGATIRDRVSDDE